MFRSSCPGSAPRCSPDDCRPPSSSFAAPRSPRPGRAAAPDTRHNAGMPSRAPPPAHRSDIGGIGPAPCRPVAQHGRGLSRSPRPVRQRPDRPAECAVSAPPAPSTRWSHRPARTAGSAGPWAGCLSGLTFDRFHGKALHHPAQRRPSFGNEPRLQIRPMHGGSPGPGSQYIAPLTSRFSTPFSRASQSSGPAAAMP